MQWRGQALFNRGVLVVFIALFLLLPLSILAAVPQLINYQGYLTDASGQPVPNGSYQITFKIYGSPAGTDIYWDNGHRSITVTNGNFGYLLGSHVPLPEGLFNPTLIPGSDTIRYLGITVGTDPEITPRTRLVTTPYAFRALNADTAYYASLVADNSITSAKVTDGSLSDIDLHPAAAIDPSKIDGTAMILNSASLQTVSGFVHFSGPVIMYDSVLKSSIYGIKIGSAVAHASDGALLEVTRDYNTTGSRYGQKVAMENSSTGSLNGFRCEVEHTTAGSGGSAYGIYGHATSDGSIRSGINALAECQNAALTTGSSYGVSASAFDGATAYGIYGHASSATTNYAGYFSGNAHVTGTLSKGGGSFKIDHPLDPENKYLQHSFVESPDMMNIYNGNVVLGSRGEALVELPEWFDALNRDFRYQLTAIGAPGPNLYIAEEIRGNRFRIAGGTPGMKVSWQVTGVRQDRWAEANRIQVELDKKPDEQGKYMHPEVYNQPLERSVDYEALRPMLEERARSLDKRGAGDE